MKQTFILILILSFSLSGFSQQDRKMIREGNRHFKAEKYEDSEIAYRKAMEDPSSDLPHAGFNLGDALYRQESFEDAQRQFETIARTAPSTNYAASAYHNLGNTLLQSGKIDECIEAYKNALRKDPNDYATKYNLAYAQNLKKQEQEQQQDNQENQENQENKDQNQQNENPENQEQQNKEQQQDPKDQENQDQSSQPQEMKISKEDAERLLQALANDEKAVQDKVKKAKAKANKIRTLKDW